MNSFSGMDSRAKKRDLKRVVWSRTRRLRLHRRNDQVKCFFFTLFLFLIFYYILFFLLNARKYLNILCDCNVFWNSLKRNRVMSEYLDRVSQNVMSDVRLRRYGKDFSRLLIDQVRESYPFNLYTKKLFVTTKLFQFCVGKYVKILVVSINFDSIFAFHIQIWNIMTNFFWKIEKLFSWNFF